MTICKFRNQFRWNPKEYFSQLCLIFRKLVGFLALKHLTKKVVSQNLNLSDPVEKVVFKQFQKVKNDTKLGLVARILETDEFVAAVDTSDHCVGFITHLDLLSFIAKGPTANGNVTNGS